MHRSLLLIVGFASVAVTLHAQDAPWKIGLAQMKITPQTPVYLAGYANRNKPFDSVVSDLYVKALVLEDAQGTRAALVTSDLIGFRAAFADTICERIAEKTGIPASHVLLNSSHTHTGPSLSIDETERWSNMTEEDARADGGLHAQADGRRRARPWRRRAASCSRRSCRTAWAWRGS